MCLPRSLRPQPQSGELAKAAEAGDEALVVELLARGADVDDVDKYGDTALYWAANSGRQGTVGLLLGGGANVGRAGQMGTPLMAAATYGHAPVCIQLLAAGAAVNAKGGSSWWTALRYSNSFGDGKCNDVLQAAGGVL